MSTRIIGRAKEGRRVASTATGAGDVNAIAIKAANGEDESGIWLKLDVQPGFAIGGQRTLPTQAESIKRGYYKQEQAGWRSEYSKNKVKRAWSL